MKWQWAQLDTLTPRELYAALALRQQVFVVEQTCAYLDADGLDDRARHLLGWEGERLVAYLRAFPPGVVYDDAAIGRVVTAPHARGLGLGRVLMEEGHRRVAATWANPPIRLSAQAHLEGFYGSLGYEVIGDGYDEDGIPHLPMRRR